MECSLGLESSKFKLLNQYHYYIVFEKPPSEKIIKYVCISQTQTNCYMYASLLPVQCNRPRPDLLENTTVKLRSVYVR